MNHLKQWIRYPAVQWIVLTCYYTAILLGLILIYGFTAAHTGTFIYNEF
ncbi:teichoic acid D-Ala incorporation-associated protein DltX [Sporolactobacillus sp. KGMB 08714]